MLLFILFLVYCSFESLECQTSERMDSLCKFDQLNRQVLQCSNFKTFKELDFNFLSSLNNSIVNREKSVRVIVLEPDVNLKLKLNSDLNLTGLKLDNSNFSNPKIIFKNLNGINAFHNPFKEIDFVNNSPSSRIFSIEIQKSVLRFDDTEKSEFKCAISHEENASEYVFSNLNLNEFLIKDSKFLSDSPLCPLLFKNSIIKRWTFNSLNPVYFAQISTQIQNDQYINNRLNVSIEKLELKFGYDSFLTILNNDNLLNRYLFNRICELELNVIYLDRIDGPSLAKFEDLKTLKLLNHRMLNFFKNGLDWMQSLNPKRKELFELEVSLFYNSFLYQDSNFCLLKDFPHENLILFQFDPENLDGDNLEDFLPCTCSIYWLYKSYLNSNLSNELRFDAMKKVPMHCLNLNPILMQEQLDYCDFDNKIRKCANSAPSSSSPETVFSTIAAQSEPCFSEQISVSELCSCKLGSLNILECTSSRLNQTLNSYKSDFKWNYVSFLGSSIKELGPNSFKNLNLARNATILLDSVILGNDIFLNETFYENEFRLLIQKSFLNNLRDKFPFRFTNFSSLELKDCHFNGLILTKAFEGARVENFVIRKSDSQSLSPFIRHTLINSFPIVRKFQLLDIYNTFRKNSEFGFSVDSTLLNDVFFNDLEELEIRNTFIDSLDSYAVQRLSHLKVIRLENINLKTVIRNFYENNLFVDETQREFSWISSVKSGQLFLGHEFDLGFRFENEFLCYFLNKSKELNVYIYDNLDSSNGVECTCTVLYIYKDLEFDNLLDDHGDNLKYIPKCIHDLKSSLKLMQKLDQCLNKKDPFSFCQDLYFGSLTSTDSIETDLYFGSLTTTDSIETDLPTNNQKPTIFLPANSTKPTETPSKEILKSIFTNSVVLIVLAAILIVLGALIFLLLVLIYKKLINLTKQSQTGIKETVILQKF